MEQYNLNSALKRLKEITTELEQGECDLEMSMKLYEEGVRLISFCNSALDNAKQRVVELSRIANGDEING